MGWNAKIGIGAPGPTHRITTMSSTVSPTTISNALPPLPSHKQSLILLNTWSTRRRAIRFYSPCARPPLLQVRASSLGVPTSSGKIRTAAHICLCIRKLEVSWQDVFLWPGVFFRRKKTRNLLAFWLAFRNLGLIALRECVSVQFLLLRIDKCF